VSGKGGRALSRVMDSWESSSAVAPCEAMSGCPGPWWEGGEIASMSGKLTAPAVQRGHGEAERLVEHSII